MSTALVTGASGGIGEALAAELAAAGTNLVLVARDENKLRGIAAALSSQHGVAVGVIKADLSAPGAGTALVATLADRQIDVLVNNAGIGDFGEFAAADAAKLGQMMQLNMVTLTELTHALLPAMMQRRNGRILNVASTAAFMPGPLMAVYYATKAYVLSLGEALANELRGTGVTVTTLCPGPVASGFQAGAEMGSSKLVKGKRLMTPQTCARIAVDAMNKGKVVVIPGFANRVQATSPKFMPRRFVPGVVRRAQAPSK